VNFSLSWGKIALLIDIIPVKYGKCSDRDLRLGAIAITEDFYSVFQLKTGFIYRLKGFHPFLGATPPNPLYRSDLKTAIAFSFQFSAVVFLGDNAFIWTF
jgi:hypothetical protein